MPNHHSHHRFTTEFAGPLPPDLQQKAARRFRTDLHPRDARGRFIETGATVILWGGGRGTVEGQDRNGRILVRRSDGKLVAAHRRYVTVTSRPGGGTPTADQADEPAEVAKPPARRPRAEATAPGRSGRGRRAAEPEEEEAELLDPSLDPGEPDHIRVTEVAAGDRVRGSGESAVGGRRDFEGVVVQVDDLMRGTPKRPMRRLIVDDNGRHVDVFIDSDDAVTRLDDGSDAEEGAGASETAAGAGLRRSPTLPAAQDLRASLRTRSYNGIGVDGWAVYATTPDDPNGWKVGEVEEAPRGGFYAIRGSGRRMRQRYTTAQGAADALLAERSPLIEQPPLPAGFAWTEPSELRVGDTVSLPYNRVQSRGRTVNQEWGRPVRVTAVNRDPVIGVLSIEYDDSVAGRTREFRWNEWDLAVGVGRRENTAAQPGRRDESAAAPEAPEEPAVAQAAAPESAPSPEVEPEASADGEQIEIGDARAGDRVTFTIPASRLPAGERVGANPPEGEEPVTIRAVLDRAPEVDMMGQADVSARPGMEWSAGGRSGAYTGTAVVRVDAEQPVSRTSNAGRAQQGRGRGGDGTQGGLFIEPDTVGTMDILDVLDDEEDGPDAGQAGEPTEDVAWVEDEDGVLRASGEGWEAEIRAFPSGEHRWSVNVGGLNVPRDGETYRAGNARRNVRLAVESARAAGSIPGTSALPEADPIPELGIEDVRDHASLIDYWGYNLPEVLPGVPDRMQVSHHEALRSHVNRAAKVELSPGGRLALVQNRNTKTWDVCDLSGFVVARHLSSRKRALAIADRVETEVVDADGVPFPLNTPDLQELRQTWRSKYGETFSEAMQRAVDGREPPAAPEPEPSDGPDAAAAPQNSPDPGVAETESTSAWLLRPGDEIVEMRHYLEHAGGTVTVSGVVEENGLRSESGMAPVYLNGGRWRSDDGREGPVVGMQVLGSANVQVRRASEDRRQEAADSGGGQEAAADREVARALPDTPDSGRRFSSVEEALEHLRTTPDAPGAGAADMGLRERSASELTLSEDGRFLVGKLRSGWMVWHAGSGRRLDSGGQHRSKRDALEFANGLGEVKGTNGQPFDWDAPALGDRIREVQAQMRALKGGRRIGGDGSPRRAAIGSRGGRQRPSAEISDARTAARDRARAQEADRQAATERHEAAQQAWADERGLAGYQRREVFAAARGEARRRAAAANRANADRQRASGMDRMWVDRRGEWNGRPADDGPGYVVYSDRRGRAATQEEIGTEPAVDLLREDGLMWDGRDPAQIPAPLDLRPDGRGGTEVYQPDNPAWGERPFGTIRRERHGWYYEFDGERSQTFPPEATLDDVVQALIDRRNGGDGEDSGGEEPTQQAGGSDGGGGGGEEPPGPPFEPESGGADRRQIMRDLEAMPRNASATIAGRQVRRRLRQPMQPRRQRSAAVASYDVWEIDGVDVPPDLARSRRFVADYLAGDPDAVAQLDRPSREERDRADTQRLIDSRIANARPRPERPAPERVPDDAGTPQERAGRFGIDLRMMRRDETRTVAGRTVVRRWEQAESGGRDWWEVDGDDSPEARGRSHQDVADMLAGYEREARPPGPVPAADLRGGDQVMVPDGNGGLTDGTVEEVDTSGPMVTAVVRGDDDQRTPVGFDADADVVRLPDPPRVEPWQAREATARKLRAGDRVLLPGDSEPVTVASNPQPGGGDAIELDVQRPDGSVETVVMDRGELLTRLVDVDETGGVLPVDAADPDAAPPAPEPSPAPDAAPPRRRARRAARPRNTDYPTGTRTGRPALYTYQRRALVELGLEGSADPVVARAARRLRDRQALSGQDAAALAEAVRTASTGEGIKPVRQRALARMADRIGALGAELQGLPEPPAAPGRDRAEKTRPANLGPGDTIAVPDGSGGAAVLRVHGVRSVMGGRLVEVEVEREDGRRETRLMTRDTDTYLLPDPPADEPVPEPEPDWEPVPAGELRPMDEAAVPTLDGETVRGTVTGVRPLLVDGEPVDDQYVVTVRQDDGTATPVLVDASGPQADRMVAGSPSARARVRAQRIEDFDVDQYRGYLDQSLAEMEEDYGIRILEMIAAGMTLDEVLADSERIVLDEDLGGYQAKFVDSVTHSIAGLAPDQGDVAALSEPLREMAANLAARVLTDLHTAMLENEPLEGETREDAAYRLVGAALDNPARRNLTGPARFLAQARAGTYTIDDPAPGQVGQVEEPSTWVLPDRIGEYRALLPDDGANFGRRQVIRSSFETPTMEELDSGAAPRWTTRTVWIDDVAEDGGPGARTMANHEVVMAAGRDLQRVLEDRLDTVDRAEQRLAMLEAFRRVAPLRQRALEYRAANGGADDPEIKEELEQRMVEFLEASVAFTAARRELTMELLREVRPDGFGGVPLDFDPVSDPEVVAGLEAATNWYPDMWLEWAAAAGPYIAIQSDAPDSYFQRAFNLFSLGQAHSRVPGTYPQSAPFEHISVHELGHAMEYAVPGLVSAESAMLWSRTSTGAIGSRVLEDPVDYEGAGTVRADEFPFPYTGRDYGGVAYEAFTTAWEGIVSGRPYTDERLEAWVLGTLALLGRDGDRSSAREVATDNIPDQDGEPLAGVELSSLSNDELFAAIQNYPEYDGLIDRLLNEMEQRENDGALAGWNPDGGQGAEPDGGPEREQWSFDEVELTDQDRAIDGLVAQGWQWRDAYAEVNDISPEQMEREERRAAVRSQQMTGESADAAVRRLYAEFVDEQYVDAEAVTRGNLLSPEGRAAGIDPRSLFSGPASRARLYASEELKRYWQDVHPRMTATEWRAMMLGREADIRAAENIGAGGNGREFGL
ncbi:hypothetical protein GCM10022221_67480 [Actinocorallia aurea]